MPDTTQAVSRFRLRWSRSNITPRFWCHLSTFDTWTAVHGCSSSLIHTWRL